MESITQLTQDFPVGKRGFPHGHRMRSGFGRRGVTGRARGAGNLEWLVAVGFAWFAASAFAAITADEITSLPGWSGALPSKQYSGLVSVNATSGRYLHYWFVESENSSSSVPVVLWLNGGPGCSSLDGYLYEHGPFHVNENNNSQLVYNPYTYTKLAHVIYLESPAGVGFSYSLDASDYITDDEATAEDNFQFLLSFFKGFPEFASRDFYIAGESYAGVYIPTLAARITTGNAAGESTINLKGFTVGNGCTGAGSGVCGNTNLGLKVRKEFFADHGLVSPALLAQIDAACGNFSSPSVTCLALVAEAANNMGNVNIYDIYAPCIQGGAVAATGEKRSRVPLYEEEKGVGLGVCVDGIAAGAYLNTPVVYKALNVAPAMQHIKQWTICSTSLLYSETAQNLPETVYPDLIQRYRVLIYNGDVDACVPYPDNQAWTSGMGYAVQADWHPWLVNQQVAGYATVYTVPNANHSFTFITVKGAGHMVPQYEPAAAYDMFSRFLNNEAF